MRPVKAHSERHVASDPNQTAVDAARFLASQIAHAVAQRGEARIAVSGGSTPGFMFTELRQLDVPWDAVHLYQVDERVAPDGDPDRNLTGLRAALLDHVAVHTHLLRVDPVSLDAPKLPDSFDVIHLGLGDDGHTASLVPDDPALDVTDHRLALTNVYKGRRRVTFTYPVLNSARTVLWLACGAKKAPFVARATAGDRGIPAGRVENPNQHWFLDNAAATADSPIPQGATP